MSEDILKKYEERLRALEAEMRKREIDAQREEAEQAEKERRELEEVIARQEQALNGIVARRCSMDCATELPKANDVGERVDDKAWLFETLQKRIRNREEEMNRIRAMLALLSADSSVPAVQEPNQSESEIKCESTEKTDDDAISRARGSIAFDGSARLDFSEAYALLSPTQKRFCDGLLAYACKQSGEESRYSKRHISVGCGSNQVIKVMIKNNIVTVCAPMEDNSLRSLRLSDTDTPIKIREATVKVVDNGAYETAKRLIDLRLTQMRELLEKKRRIHNEKRKAARRSKAHSDDE